MAGANPSVPKNLKITDLPPDKQKDIRNVFNMFDKNGDGAVSNKELTKMFRNLGQNPTKSMMKQLMKEVDRDRNGSLDIDEFAYMYMKYKKDDPEQDLINAFKYFDRNGDGFITPEEMMEVFKMCGIAEGKTLESCKEAIRLSDANGDGKLTVEEFAHMLAHQ